MPRIALVTCLALPEPDVDADLTLSVLLEEGVEAEWAAWDDSSVDWASFDLAVVRSPWDYPVRLEEFRGFLKRLDGLTRVLNPVEVMLENLHKGYLLKLAKAGVPVVPTRLVSEGSLQGLCFVEGWTKVVVKPAVGAGSMGTRVFDLSDGFEGGEEHLVGLLLEGDALVQPYLSSVESGGEVATVVIDGEPTHSVVKSPRFADGEESVSAALEVTEELRAFALEVLSHVEGDLLYARVDTMRGPEGELWLSELELIEPSLFFLQHRDAAVRFGRTVAKRVG